MKLLRLTARLLRVDECGLLFKGGESNEDVNNYYAQFSVAIIVLYDEIEFIATNLEENYTYIEKGRLI